MTALGIMNTYGGPELFDGVAGQAARHFKAIWTRRFPKEGPLFVVADVPADTCVVIFCFHWSGSVHCFSEDVIKAARDEPGIVYVDLAVRIDGDSVFQVTEGLVPRMRRAAEAAISMYSAANWTPDEGGIQRALDLLMCDLGQDMDEVNPGAD